MKPDELSMILDFMATLTSDAKWAFIAWLVAKYVTSFIALMTLIIGAALTIRVIAKEVRASQDDHQFAETICAAFGVHWQPYAPTESLHELMAAIKKPGSGK